MASFYDLLQPHLSLKVCSFLDCRDLSSVELAGFDQRAVLACWTDLRLAAEESLIGNVWLPPDWHSLPEQPKVALHELSKRLRNIAKVPQNWTPAIRRVSAECVQVIPRTHAEAEQRRPDDGGLEDYADPSLPLVPPKLAAVPLALGLDRETRWVAGVRMSARRAHLIGEGCLLAAEFVGVRAGQGLVTALLFAPVSGRVFMRFAGDREGLVAQPMPALRVETTEDVEREELEAFLYISAAGAVSFCRRLVGKDQVDWSGELPPEFFPAWADERFASLNFQIDQLEEPAEIRTTWARPEPPASLGHMPLCEFSATWSDHEWW